MKTKSNCLAVALLIALSSPVTLSVQDDTLYISSVNGNKVYRVSSTGIVSAFATINLLPEGLAFGTNGLLYVANDGGNWINRVTTSGTPGFVSGGVHPHTQEKIPFAHSNARSLDGG
jgi:sugar lactone lactonase YvrE